MPVVEVLPDVGGIDRSFHYSSPEELPVGTIVRVVLHNRRVRGWVLSSSATPPVGVEPRPIEAVASLGPPEHVTELASWSSVRWAGRLRPLLAAASPPRLVSRFADLPSASEGGSSGGATEEVTRALQAGDAVVRLPPASERLPFVEAILEEAGGLEGGLVLVESRDDAHRLAGHLRRRGWPVASYPEEWAASPGRVTVGTRNAAFAPSLPSVILVLDAHSDAYRSERVPSFDSRIVAAERARRGEVPVVFVSPCPPLVLSQDRALVHPAPALERAGWGTITLLDEKEEDPAERGLPSSLIGWVREAARRGGRAVCILNRTGRARLLSCPVCRVVQRCSRCGAAESEPAELPRHLECPRCGATRAPACSECGAGRLRTLRPGVSRARELLAAATGLEVGEVSGRSAEVPETAVVMATQAALHRIRSASLVCFLDFDQELLAPRYLASEQALSLLARAVRLVGGRGGGGRVVVRTSMPGHEVLQAATGGDPSLLAGPERDRRRLLALPPFAALARITGPAAPELGAALARWAEVSRIADGVIVRASSPSELADALGRCRPAEGGWAAVDARVEVDPLDL